MTHRVLPLGPGREFDAIRAMVARWGPLAVGMGSDCATIDVAGTGRLVVSTDTSVEGVHFRREWMTPAQIGYRATTAALSDLAASAATPVGVLVAMTVPERWQPDLLALADGIGEAVRAAGTVVVGGDTTAGPVLVLTVTVIGQADRPLTRAGARPGDHVYVTGTFGGPAAAVRALLRGQQPSAAVMSRFLRPSARLAAGRWLAERGAVAAIDVSDGLAGDLAHVAAAGGVRLVIDVGQVPRVEGEPGEVTVDDVTAGGEEYELAVIGPEGLDTAAFRAAFGVTLTDIGVVSDGGDSGVEFTLDGQRVDPPRSWDHFSE